MAQVKGWILAGPNFPRRRSGLTKMAPKRMTVILP
ncbi:hypothetical protein COLO4_24453 [Corchorus olitorius]|uniref:Uncharacterized protein n=1 Tax=Corchorus olitorius TaxID=93759 RepID=A0A1R3I9Y5_9ROSI|nr:hypothetical protein COLO4_24453 [Corchorus olitorius]